MNNFSTWDYMAIAAGGLLLYAGFKHSGASKILTYVGAGVLFYGVYQDYSNAGA